MLGLGTNELLIILFLVLILFGANKVPQLMRGMGEGMKEFKKATRDDEIVSSDTTTTRVTTEAPPNTTPPSDAPRV